MLVIEKVFLRNVIRKILRHVYRQYVPTLTKNGVKYVHSKLEKLFKWLNIVKKMLIRLEYHVWRKKNSMVCIEIDTKKKKNNSKSKKIIRKMISSLGRLYKSKFLRNRIL